MTTAQGWEVRLARAEQTLRRGDVSGAAAQARELSIQEPRREAPHYLLAVCARYAKQPEDAHAHLRRLLELAPEHARGFQELGHLYRDTAAPAAAVAAYRQAVSFNPALLTAWRAMLDLLNSAQIRQQNPELRAQAARQIDRLSSLPRELLAVTSNLYEGKLFRGEQVCRSFLQRQPHHPEAMRLLAQLGLKLGILDDAEFLLESCLELYPDFQRARLDLVDVLHRRQKYRLALTQAEQLVAADPVSPAHRVALANENMALGRYEAALEAYRQLLAEVPDPAGIYLAIGHAQKTRGSGEEAVSAYRQAYAARPDFGDAYWSLANLKTYRFTAGEITRMTRGAQNSATGRVDRYHLCFALGKAEEDRGAYDLAFDWYRQGNALKRAGLDYRAERVTQEMQQQQVICDRPLFDSFTGGGSPARDPIFIVGLPRAGSTLLEQILSAHSQVDGTFELPNVLAIAHRLGGRRRTGEASKYPAILADLTPERLQQLGEHYLAETAVYREGAAFFTDKMPNNFRHLGLIALMFPNARIVDARRHPMACCFSGFKQLFAEGQEFSYSLEDLGHYYRDYLKLMDHWHTVLPGRIHCVQHETLLEDFEGQVRALLDFCGLPFEDGCLSFHTSRRSVRTASAEQVRQPLQRGGTQHWRHFSAHLDPLRDALGDVLNRYPE